MSKIKMKVGDYEQALASMYYQKKHDARVWNKSNERAMNHIVECMNDEIRGDYIPVPRSKEYIAVLKSKDKEDTYVKFNKSESCYALGRKIRNEINK